MLHEEHHIASNFHSEGCALLREHGQVDIVTMRSGQETAALEPFSARLKEADAAVIGCWHQPAMQPEHWHQAENLKVFAGTFDNRFAGWVDFDVLDARGITLIDTSRSMTPSVAEFALAMTLNLIRDIPETMATIVSVGFERAFLLQQPATYSVSDVIATYVYRRGLIKFDFSYGAAIGLFDSIIAFMLVVAANYIVKSTNEDRQGLW